MRYCSSLRFTEFVPAAFILIVKKNQQINSKSSNLCKHNVLRLKCPRIFSFSIVEAVFEYLHREMSFVLIMLANKKFGLMLNMKLSNQPRYLGIFCFEQETLFNKTNTAKPNKWISTQLASGSTRQVDERRFNLKEKVLRIDS